MVGRRTFRKERRGQVAIADAILALIILVLASAILYSAVAGMVTSNSADRQRTELKTTAMTVGSMPLEASCPKVTFSNMSSGEDHVLENTTGQVLLGTYFELALHSQLTGDQYSLEGLKDAIEDLYSLALRGRGYTVHTYSQKGGTYIDILFSSNDDVRGNIDTVSDVPHPRVVTQKLVHHSDLAITIDLYVWK